MENDTSLPPQRRKQPRRGRAGHSLHPQASRMEMCISLLPPLPGHLLSGRSHALCGWTQKTQMPSVPHTFLTIAKLQVGEETAAPTTLLLSLTPAHSFSNPCSSADLPGPFQRNLIFFFFFWWQPKPIMYRKRILVGSMML